MKSSKGGARFDLCNVQNVISSKKMPTAKWCITILTLGGLVELKEPLISFNQEVCDGLQVSVLKDAVDKIHTMKLAAQSHPAMEKVTVFIS